MSVRYIFLLSLCFCWTIDSVYAGFDWQKATLKQFSAYVSSTATEDELRALAQKQFYFEISSDHTRQIQYYQQLQQALADQIPVEYERPVFDIKVFYGDADGLQAESTIGILGGIGPLSDASILSMIHAKLGAAEIHKNVAIHLYSLPPPRTSWQQLRGGILYGARLARFLTHGYRSYYLASNTAHVNLATISRITGKDRLKNLVQMVAARISREMPALGQGDSVLILGTTQAWEAKLYDPYLDQEGIAYRFLQAPEQKQLQTQIDAIKRGSWSNADAQQLALWLQTLAEKYGVKTLLLACTELPLGLHSELASFASEGFLIVDTEQFFAESIAKDLMQTPGL